MMIALLVVQGVFNVAVVAILVRHDAQIARIGRWLMGLRKGAE